VDSADHFDRLWQYETKSEPLSGSAWFEPESNFVDGTGERMPSNLIPASHRDLLDKPVLAHVATIGPKGEPQSNPVWFILDGENIVISIGPEGQKAKNLERDPRIALSMADPENPIHYLEVRGRVVDVRQVDSRDPDVIAMVRKYTGADSYDGMPDRHALYAIEPLRSTVMG
jgi:PPOX class probable F420-dependent enzyme